MNVYATGDVNRLNLMILRLYQRLFPLRAIGHMMLESELMAFHFLAATAATGPDICYAIVASPPTSTLQCALLSSITINTIIRRHRPNIITLYSNYITPVRHAKHMRTHAASAEVKLL